MLIMGPKDRQSNPNSPRLEVGEIDTRAPFQSVKAAVSLFGEATTPKEKPLSRLLKSTAERVLDKETQLHLAEKELEKLKEKLKNADNAKGRSHFDLERAKRTLQDLNCKLDAVNESKKAAIEATEAARIRAKQLEEVCIKEPIRSPGAWRRELDQEREHYRTASNELAIVKQELRKIQQDFDSFLDAKIVAFQQAADAQHAVKINREKVIELSKDIAAMQDTLSHLKLATSEAKEEHIKIMSERDARQKSHIIAMEEAERKTLLSLNEDVDLEFANDLEGKLAEETREIEDLQEQIKAARASCLDSVRILNLELNDSKKALQSVTEEERSLQSSVDSLRLELENVKKDLVELKEKEAEVESVTGNLSMEVEKSKAKLATTLEEENKAEVTFHEMISSLQQLSSESDLAKKEVEEIKKSIEELKKEAETFQLASSEAEKKLMVVEEEAKEARSASETAHDQMKVKMAHTDSDEVSSLDSGSGAKIKLSIEAFESLTRKVEECDSLAEEKVATITAEIQGIQLREAEAFRKMDTTYREMEAMEIAKTEALKKAEMAEAAKNALEGELKRMWEQEQEQEQEQKKAPASEISEVSEMSSPPALLL